MMFLRMGKRLSLNGRCNFGQQLVKNKMMQINQKALALKPQDDQLEEHESKHDQLSCLVPNFFAHSAHLQIKQLKQEFKTTFQDQYMNSVTNSFLQVQIPIGINETLRDQLTKLDSDCIRIGRLLEILDGLMGLVAYKYCYADVDNQKSRPVTIVTLAVNNYAAYHYEMKNDQNIIINSYVTYVGHSSIEIQADLYQENELVATVQSLMVARDVNNYGKSVQVPQLQLEEEIEGVKDICLLRYEVGKQNQQMRLLDRQQSLTKLPPDEAESKVLHQIFLNCAGGVRINDTKTDKNALMHKQERNVHGKVFGGHIMHEIAELGWLCAFKLHKSQILHIVQIFDVIFVAPVPIGSCVQFNSRVVFTEGNIMIVEVKLSTLTFKEGEQQETLTTEVHLALAGDTQISQQVYPVTYEEGMAYLQGKRLYSKL